jgi:hypothetical protein
MFRALMVARDGTRSLVLISFQFCPRSSLAVPQLQSATTGAAQPGKIPGTPASSQFPISANDISNFTSVCRNAKLRL